VVLRYNVAAEHGREGCKIKMRSREKSLEQTLCVYIKSSKMLINNFL